MKTIISGIIAILISSFNLINAQTAYLTGTTYEERSASLIRTMTETTPVSNGKIKYVAPFYFARILNDVDTDNAVTQLSNLYTYQINHIDEFYKSGSDMDFFAHATIHGYMLTKDKMPESLKVLIKNFMMLGKYNYVGTTLNMDMMHKIAGFLCCEEWADFVDADGNDAGSLKMAVRAEILSMLREFVLKNCSEADSFIYLITNLQYVRLLAEFAKDDEMRNTAINTYHHMTAQLILPWNDGMYCANPARSKGWENLYTGNLSTRTQLPLLSWLLFGGSESHIINKVANNGDNYGCFTFWLAYPGNIKPLETFQSVMDSKVYPYDFEAVRLRDTWHDVRYTYQSHNYGLSTQTEVPYDGKRGNFQYKYAFKETKNLHLVWRSDVTDAAVFSVSLDNPERPQKHQTVSNKIGYGENPYHRVFGYKKSAVGVYNVAKDYMDTPVFYRMYVPFSQKGILRRVEKEIGGNKWILCHTGSMMFAFSTPEEYEYEQAGGKFYLKDHDVLILKDRNCRRGSWVLETTEIAPYATGGDMNAELEKFATAIGDKIKIELSADYATSTKPKVTYTNIDGDVIEVTFFAPTDGYKNYYCVNGKSMTINRTYISKSDYMTQAAEQTVLTLKSGKIDFATPASMGHIIYGLEYAVLDSEAGTCQTYPGIIFPDNTIYPGHITSGAIVMPSTVKDDTGVSYTVTKIGEASYCNQGISSVIIPSTVTAIGERAFAGCRDLTRITCVGIVPPAAAENVFDDDIYENARLVVPVGYEHDYRSASPWNRFHTIVGSDVSSITPVLTDRDMYHDVYNLQGILIRKNAPPEFINTLPTGLYISDGRKIFVK